jgi:hypothetical protein
MKKVSKILAILLFITTIGFSQNFNKVYKANNYYYANGDWNLLESNYPERVFIITDKNIIKITNQSESRYATYGDAMKLEKADYQQMSWNAYDKDGKSCRIVIKNYHAYDRFSMDIIYDNYALQFICER